ncbi:hypothetical protein H8959_014226 [Pygathrix nigripes]
MKGFVGHDNRQIINGIQSYEALGFSLIALNLTWSKKKDNQPTQADTCIVSDSPERGLQGRPTRRRRPERAYVLLCVTAYAGSSRVSASPMGVLRVELRKMLVVVAYLFAEIIAWVRKSNENEASILSSLYVFK